MGITSDAQDPTDTKDVAIEDQAVELTEVEDDNLDDLAGGAEV